MPFTSLIINYLKYAFLKNRKNVHFPFQKIIKYGKYLNGNMLKHSNNIIPKLILIIITKHYGKLLDRYLNVDFIYYFSFFKVYFKKYVILIIKY
jgi:hypothetical protein